MHYETNKTPSADTGIIVPPGCDNPMLHQCGEAVSTFTPASYRPFSSKDVPYPLPPHAMHGKTGGLSVPKGNIESQCMADYLNRFSGAFLCLDFWLSHGQRIKKCGILEEVGKTFLVLKESRKNVLTVVDLKPVRYISIYCR